MDRIGVEFKHLISYIIPGIFTLGSIEYKYDILNYANKYKIFDKESSIILLLIFAIGLGMIVNAVTWCIIRPIVELTGAKRPKIDYGKLKSDQLDTYKVIIESNFNYYQSYANMLTSLLIFMASYIAGTGKMHIEVLIMLIISILILFFAARDSLKRSYTRMNALLS